MRISPIIEIDELLKIHKNSDLLIFDVSNGKDAALNYQKEHLEGAFFIDLNSQLADIKKDLSQGGRHPLPTVENFTKTLTEMGIAKHTYNHL